MTTAFHAKERLARRAAAGDLHSAKRLVATLEEEGAFPVTRPEDADARIRETLIEKVEEAIRNSHTPNGAFLRLWADEPHVRDVVMTYQRAGWTVIVANQVPDDEEEVGRSLWWHLTLSAFRPQG